MKISKPLAVTALCVALAAIAAGVVSDPQVPHPALLVAGLSVTVLLSLVLKRV
jgi:hypothetical protein